MPVAAALFRHGQTTRRYTRQETPGAIRAQTASSRSQGTDRPRALRRPGTVDAGEDLLSIVGSWRDTLNDAEVLSLLREYNTTGKVLHRPQ
jgi:hypothetical protein